MAQGEARNESARAHISASGSRALEARDGSDKTYPQSGEEPLGLSSQVSLLEQLLDHLLSVLSMRRLLERLRCDGALEAVQLE